MRKIVCLALATAMVMVCSSDVLHTAQGEAPKSKFSIAKEKKYRQEQLFAAIKAGDLEEVKNLIDTVGIEKRDEWGTTPLTEAVIDGKRDIVEYLVGKNANLEAQDFKKRTPLIWAVAQGNYKIVSYLKGKGANLEAQDIDGTTPLIQAIRNQDLKMVNLLLQLGAQPKAAVDVFQEYVTNGKLSDVKNFVQQVTWIIKQKYFDDAFIAAAAKGHLPIVKFFIGKYLDRIRANITPAISAAIDNGHAKVVEYLIKTASTIIKIDEDAIQWLSQLLTRAQEQREKWNAGLASDYKRYDVVVKVIEKEQARFQKLEKAQQIREHRELMERERRIGWKDTPDPNQAGGPWYPEVAPAPDYNPYL
ncbi:MAG: ankyrin repeat domain-containing protein [Candidatus Babeliales bacterium]|jgi:ankyrin repeat protein